MDPRVSLTLRCSHTPTSHRRNIFFFHLKQRHISVWKGNVSKQTSYRSGPELLQSLLSSVCSFTERDGDATRPTWSKARSLFQATQHGMSSFSGTTPPQQQWHKDVTAQHRAAATSQSLVCIHKVLRHLKKKRKKIKQIISDYESEPRRN